MKLKQSNPYEIGGINNPILAKPYLIPFPLPSNSNKLFPQKNLRAPLPYPLRTSALKKDPIPPPTNSIISQKTTRE